MLKLRQSSDQHQAIALTLKEQLNQQFLASLPFSPTNAQARVVNEVQKDLAKNIPMMRLVQGDVGSGKPWLPPFRRLLPSVKVIKLPSWHQLKF